MSEGGQASEGKQGGSISRFRLTMSLICEKYLGTSNRQLNVNRISRDVSSIRVVNVYVEDAARGGRSASRVADMAHHVADQLERLEILLQDILRADGASPR